MLHSGVREGGREGRRESEYESEKEQERERDVNRVSMCGGRGRVKNISLIVCQEVAPAFFSDDFYSCGPTEPVKQANCMIMKLTLMKIQVWRLFTFSIS